MNNVTVTICTLNEEKNIKECLDSVIAENPDEIIVVDGDSSDQTRNIINQFNKPNIKLIHVEKKGLAYQRKIGIENVKTKYVCILDADHRLNKYCLKSLIEEMNEKKYSGIEASIRKSNSDKNYWNDCFDINFLISHNTPGETIMIGTPCIYLSEIVKKINFDPFFTGPSDDTDLCYRLIKNGYKLGVGTALINHKNRVSFLEFFNKIIWYGKGDAQFVYKHPERIHRMIYHQVINYPIIKNIKAVRNGHVKSIPFFFFYGILRFISMFFNLIKFSIKGTKDNNIQST